jgi:hypothetical protein
MKAVEATGWYVSAPHWSHVYVATCIIGFTCDGDNVGK